MAPVSKLCKEFLASLVSTENKISKKDRRKKGFQRTYEDFYVDSDSDIEEVHQISKTTEERKRWSKREEALKDLTVSSKKLIKQNNYKLEELLSEELCFEM